MVTHCIGVSLCVVLYRGIAKNFAGQNLKGKTQSDQNLIGRHCKKQLNIEVFFKN